MTGLTSICPPLTKSTVCWNVSLEYAIVVVILIPAFINFIGLKLIGLAKIDTMTTVPRGLVASILCSKVFCTPATSNVTSAPPGIISLIAAIVSHWLVQSLPNAKVIQEIVPVRVEQTGQ